MLPLNLGLFHKMVHLKGRGSAKCPPVLGLLKAAVIILQIKIWLLSGHIAHARAAVCLALWGSLQYPLLTLSYFTRWDHLSIFLLTHLTGKNWPWRRQDIVFENYLGYITFHSLDWLHGLNIPFPLQM